MLAITTAATPVNVQPLELYMRVMIAVPEVYMSAFAQCQRFATHLPNEHQEQKDPIHP